jgi:hypothetical protein
MGQRAIDKNATPRKQLTLVRSFEMVSVWLAQKAFTVYNSNNVYITFPHFLKMDRLNQKSEFTRI